MPAQLLALSDGPSLILDKPIILVGRHGECDIQLNSRKVSRRHCCVAQVNDYLVVRDMGSTNGIRINGQRVLEGRLKAGDELTVGNFRYQVYFDPPSGPVAKVTASDAHLEQADQPVPIEDVGNRTILAAKKVPADPTSDSIVLPAKLRNPEPPA